MENTFEEISLTEVTSGVSTEETAEVTTEVTPEFGPQPDGSYLSKFSVTVIYDEEDFAMSAVAQMAMRAQIVPIRKPYPSADHVMASIVMLSPLLVTGPYFSDLEPFDKFPNVLVGTAGEVFQHVNFDCVTGAFYAIDGLCLGTDPDYKSIFVGDDGGESHLRSALVKGLRLRWERPHDRSCVDFYDRAIAWLKHLTITFRCFDEIKKLCIEGNAYVLACRKIAAGRLARGKTADGVLHVRGGEVFAEIVEEFKHQKSQPLCDLPDALMICDDTSDYYYDTEIYQSYLVRFLADGSTSIEAVPAAQ